MRFLFLALLLILPSSAFAQSRVVYDTFADERESHRQSSTETFQNYQDDGAVMMKERTAAAAEEVDADRVQRREETDASRQQWVDDWNADADTRTARREEDDVMREDRRTASIAAPGEWWGTDVPADEINADDYDDLNQ